MDVFRAVQVRAEGPVAAGSLLWRYRGELHLTAIVKATFAIALDGGVSIAAPDDLLPADLYLDDDPRRSLLRASDRVAYRPEADVVLTGCAYPPAGRGPRALARLGVRRDRVLIDKTIHVVDDRTALSSFSRMPLTYERAFGGPGRPDNPVGADATANLIDPRGEGHPICFGPIAAAWPSRARLSGTGPVPWAGLEPVAEIAADFDWAYFQAAPPDQRIEFLQGDEWILLEGLHPEVPRIMAHLPAVRATGSVLGPPGSACPESQPLELDADGLHIDAERLTCTITWRTAMPVGDERDLAKLQLTLGITVGGAKVRASRAATASFESTLALSQETIARAMRTAKALPFATGERVAQTAAAPPLRRPPLPPRAFEGTLDLTGTPAAQNAPAWLDPAGVGDEPMTLRLPAAAELPSVEQTFVLHAEAKAPPAVLPFRGAPAGGPRPSPPSTPATPWASEPIVRAPQPTGSFEGTLDLSPRPAPAPAAVSAPVVAEPPVPEPLPAVAAPRVEIAAPRIEAGADLRGLDFRRADLARADLRGAILTGCTFDEARLDDADLTGATLDGASFRGASLAGACFDDAHGKGVVLDGAKMSAARARRADLPAGSFENIEGEGTLWEMASLDGASFRGANLRGACFSRASCARADFSGADATDGDFQALEGDGAHFDGATLERADLRRASLRQAGFEGAVLRKALANKAKLGEARLQRADLTGATLRDARLQRADLEGAKLHAADLRDADLEGAFVHGASMATAKTAGANLKGAVETARARRAESKAR